MRLRYGLPKINGKAGRSMGVSGAPTITRVPFTFNSSRMGPRECWPDTVSKIKSRLLFFDCPKVAKTIFYDPNPNPNPNI